MRACLLLALCASAATLQVDTRGVRAALAPAARDGAAALAVWRSRAADEAALAAQQKPAWLERIGRLVASRPPPRGCWASALDALDALDCAALGEEAHARLALALASCTHVAAGRPALSCAAGRPWAACARKLKGDAWTSFELARRDITAVCISLSLDARLANFTSAALEAASALAEGVADVGARLEQQRALSVELRAAQELALARQSRHIALSASALEAAEAHGSAIGAVAGALGHANALASEALASARGLAEGLGWLLRLREAAAEAALFAGAALVARAAWRLGRTRRARRREEEAMERRLRSVLHSEMSSREAALLTAVEARLAAMEARLLSAVLEAAEAASEHAPRTRAGRRRAAGVVDSSRRGGEGEERSR